MGLYILINFIKIDTQHDRPSSGRVSKPDAAVSLRRMGRHMKIDGRCHCGQITFEADVDPQAVTICHCTDCQMLTGSAFRANIIASREHFKIRTGTPKAYVKTADSGNRRRHAFCMNCGTPIYSCAVGDPEHYSLRVGTIKQRAVFSPYRQIWRRSALDWVDKIDAVPASQEG